MWAVIAQLSQGFPEMSVKGWKEGNLKTQEMIKVSGWEEEKEAKKEER